MWDLLGMWNKFVLMFELFLSFWWTNDIKTSNIIDDAKKIVHQAYYWWMLNSHYKTSTIFFFWLCDVTPNTITIYPLRFAPSSNVKKKKKTHHLLSMWPWMKASQITLAWHREMVLGLHFCMICWVWYKQQSITPDREECNKCDLTVARVSGLPFVMIHPGGLLLVVSYVLAVLILLYFCRWVGKKKR